MKISRVLTVFDTDDLAVESTFWAGLLGGTVNAEEEYDWHTVSVDGVEQVAFQLVPNHVRPEWPHGQPQQLHVDLWVDDLPAGHEKVLALGGTLLQTCDEAEAKQGWRVYADPSGHPFCLCWFNT